MKCGRMFSNPHWALWLHAIRPPGELAELALAAEALGAAAILVADEGTDRDLYVTLAVLAQRTHRCLLFGAVTNPHSRHPVATAAAFATLAELAPGRIVAGFGTGGSRVFGPMGLSSGRPFTALVECVDVVQALWSGEVVDHTGEFAAHAAALPWSAGRLPIGIAGRGPRVERLAARRADWMLLAGRGIENVGPLVAAMRAEPRLAHSGPLSIAWNPSAAWTEPMVAEIRSHLAYMVVDMPLAERAAFGPDTILDRYAVTGDRPRVVARLSELVTYVRPELLVFEAHDYSIAYVEDVAAIALDVGITPFQNKEATD
jgi:alkanesulfonate monooxygenase SsuD/methylene tetrahydromethanopterin reductase-like flavin-dependent oxidoreductase (luciferase family)